MLRTQPQKGEFATFQDVGGLMWLECAERDENEGYGETRGSQHAICADLSKDSYLSLFPVEEEWVMLVRSD